MGQASAKPSVDDLYMINTKIGKLKQQGRQLSTMLIQKVDQLGDDCLTTMHSSPKNAGSLIAFRLDCYSEFLENLSIKLQAQALEIGDLEGAMTSSVQKSFSSLTSALVKRVETLEEAGEKLNQKCDDLEGQFVLRESSLEDSIKQLDSKVDFVTSDVRRLEASSLLAPTPEDIENTNNRLDEAMVSVSNLNGHMDSLSADYIDTKSQVTEISARQKGFKKKQKESTEALQLLARKVHQLQKLRLSLNEVHQHAQDRPSLRAMCEETHSNLDKMREDVETKLQALEDRVNRPMAKFTASLTSPSIIRRPCAIKQLNITCNVGNCYKYHQAHFVAPHDGLYCFFVNSRQSTTQDFVLSLMSKNRGEEAKEEMQFPVYGDAPFSTMCYMNLPKDRQVFVKLICPADVTINLTNLMFSGRSVVYD